VVSLNLNASRLICLHSTHGASDRRKAWERRPPAPGTRILFALVLLVVGAALIAAGVTAADLGLEHIFAERHIALEGLQFGLWCAIPIIAALGALRQRSRRGLCLVIWIAVLAAVAGLRELDFQVLFNPENIHRIGLTESAAIRWNPRWWFDGDVSLLVRLVWALVLLGFGTAILLPFGMSHYPWFARLARFDRFPWLFVAGVILLGLGFSLDDFIGRPMKHAVIDVSFIEEFVELAGVGCFAAWTTWLALGRPDLRLESGRKA
jgi:hypothetical protein